MCYNILHTLALGCYGYEKHIERKKPLYMTFVDQENEFDRVVRAEFWKCIEERGILGELLRAVQYVYISSQASVKSRGAETDWFEVNCGLAKGCVLSTLLFIIFMDNIMKRASQEEDGIEELMFVHCCSAHSSGSG